MNNNIDDDLIYDLISDHNDDKIDVEADIVKTITRYGRTIKEDPK